MEMWAAFIPVRTGLTYVCREGNITFFVRIPVAAGLGSVSRRTLQNGFSVFTKFEIRVYVRSGYAGKVRGKKRNVLVFGKFDIVITVVCAIGHHCYRFF
jgi:hypothetical protein